MAISRSLMLILLLICGLGIGVYSEAVGGGEPLPCIQKLLPCQAFLIGSAAASKSVAAPTAACCVPLKQMVVSDTQCVCAVFNNLAILKTLNVTQDDALSLAKTCGANADISICNKAAPPGSPSIPAAPSTNGSETNAPPKNNASTTTTNTTTTLYSLLSTAIIMIFIVTPI